MVKQSKIFAQQPKTKENPKILDIKWQNLSQIMQNYKGS